MNRLRQSGQGSVELIVVMVLFAALITGLFEMTRVFRAKHTLNTATFMADRAGALHNAKLDPMNAALANGMTPLFSSGASSVTGLTTALAKAQAFANALRMAGGGVQIVSPTRDIFNQLSHDLYLPNPDDTGLLRIHAIPNDNLRWRPAGSANVDVSVNGATEHHQINVQDANLLKIRSLWCQRLVVPGLDRAIYDIVNTPLFFSARQGVCSRLTAASQATGIATGYYIAISADSTLRMQTPIVGDDLP